MLALCGLLQLTGCTAIGTNQVSTNALQPGELPKPGAAVAHALLHQASDAYHRGDFRAAQAKVRRAQRYSPHLAPAHLLAAQIARDMNRRSECVAELRAAAAADPNSARLQFEVGQQLLQYREFAAATPILSRAAELEPHQVKYTEVLAAAYREAGQRSQSDALLAEMSRRHPDNRDVQTLLAQLQPPAAPSPIQPAAQPDAPVQPPLQVQTQTPNRPRFALIANLLQSAAAERPTVLPEIQTVAAVDVKVDDGWRPRIAQAKSGWKPHRAAVATERHIEQTSCLIEVVEAPPAAPAGQPLVAADLSATVR
jgi:tetratricopeptide (TPR) repeat protein